MFKRLIRLNRSPEGEGGGTAEPSGDAATIEKLSADVEKLTTNNDKLLGEVKSVRTLNSDILSAFGVDSTGSASDKLEAVKSKLTGKESAASSASDELSQLQSTVKTLQTSLADITQSKLDETTAKDKLSAEGEIRKQLVESKVVAGAHDMILATVLGKSDKSDDGFGVMTAKGRVTLADYTKEVVTGIPQIVEAQGRPGAAPKGGDVPANKGPETYDSLIAKGLYSDAMALKNK